MNGMSEFNTVQDPELRKKIVDGYEFANSIWKLHGPFSALKYIHQVPYARGLLLGLELSEIDRVINSCTSFYRGSGRDWPTQWFKAGDEYYDRGRVALNEGHTHTAAQMLFSAASCYHLAGYMLHTLGALLPEARRSHARCAEIYWEAAPHFSPPALRADIPFGDVVIPAFLRLPPSVDNPTCVVMVNGANSNRLNLHPVSDYFLERGIATLALDGPGQGEYLACTGRPMVKAQFVKAMSAAVDWLERDGRVDANRVGIYGRATGSMIGIHSAALDKRFKAVIAHPAFFNMDPYFDRVFATLVSHRLEIYAFLGAKSEEQGRQLVREQLTIADIVDRIDFPILSLCSADDEMIPTSETETLRQRAKGPVEVVIFPGKGHGGPSKIALPLEADWLCRQLRKLAPSRYTAERGSH